MTVRLGRWQDVLADVEQCDAVICDPPYGARTHNADGARADGARADGVRADGLRPGYDGFIAADCDEVVDAWAQRCKGWMVFLTSHDLIIAWQDAMERNGMCSFAPLPCVMRGMSVRLAGDGPSSWACYAVVGRPRTKAMQAWGTLPGAYTGAPSREAGGGRGKPAWLMRAIVSDYSRPGDLVVDPFAGWGSTLEAAIGLDRRALGAEMDPEAHAECTRRLRRGQQRDLFTGAVAS